VFDADSIFLVTSARWGRATVPWPSAQTLKINVYTALGSVHCQYSAVHTKMLNFRRITRCLETVSFYLDKCV